MNEKYLKDEWVVPKRLLAYANCVTKLNGKKRCTLHLKQDKYFHVIAPFGMLAFQRLMGIRQSGYSLDEPQPFRLHKCDSGT